MQAQALITLDNGRYRLLEPIARSAYGIVWRAARDGDALPCAIKLVNAAQMALAHPSLHSRWTDSAANEIRFLRSLAPWDERHIVRLLGSGMHDRQPVMALELLSQDLGRHVAVQRESGRRIPLAQVLAWLAQINQALAKVHQYGWCYLDLKPGNLLLHPRDGGLRLSDFGTSRPQAAGPAPSYSGTASWQAPEQFFPNAARCYDVDARSDYFALGALFYYLVTNGHALRFCGACGQAYREHQSGAAAWLLERHGGSPPPTLQGDEAQEFSMLAGEPALDLLRSLLAAERGMRPASALDISRRIAAIHAAAPSHHSMVSA